MIRTSDVFLSCKPILPDFIDILLENLRLGSHDGANQRALPPDHYAKQSEMDCATIIAAMKYDSLSLHLTARDGNMRLAAQPAVALIPISPELENLPFITVDDRVTYQEIEGFGGAFTEAAAVTLQKMPKEKHEEILRAYFDKDSGHGYSLCRTHINSCDFALGNYAYCEQEADFELKSFSIERDRTALLPMIQHALRISGNGFKLFASPWSPPAWMKTTG